jgi:hypothetical protein
MTSKPPLFVGQPGDHDKNTCLPTRRATFKDSYFSAYPPHVPEHSMLLLGPYRVAPVSLITGAFQALVTLSPSNIRVTSGSAFHQHDILQYDRRGANPSPPHAAANVLSH